MNALKKHFENLNSINIDRNKETDSSTRPKKNLILDLTIREASDRNIDDSKTVSSGTILMQQTLILQDDRNLHFVLTKTTDGSYRLQNILATDLQTEKSDNRIQGKFANE